MSQCGTYDFVEHFDGTSFDIECLDRPYREAYRNLIWKGGGGNCGITLLGNRFGKQLRKHYRGEAKYLLLKPEEYPMSPAPRWTTISQY